MPALWETDTDVGRRLMEAWEGEGSVFLVIRRFEVYQELEKLNGESMCRWLAAPTPPDVDADDEAKSVSTIKTDDAAPSLGVICLRTPRFFYEKTKAGLPTCFLFGRASAGRKVDVCLGRTSKSSLSRVHFALGLKNDTWAVRGMCQYPTAVNQNTQLDSGRPSYALWRGRVNIIEVCDIELEVYCRDSRDAANYIQTIPRGLKHGRSTKPTPALRL